MLGDVLWVVATMYRPLAAGFSAARMCARATSRTSANTGAKFCAVPSSHACRGRRAGSWRLGAAAQDHRPAKEAKAQPCVKRGRVARTFI